VIATLEDAWRWYRSVHAMSRILGRLGERHWPELDWDGRLGQDAVLVELSRDQIIEDAAVIQADLDDLCVLLLFSVFEALVRERVLRDFDAEAKSATHAAVQRAMRSIRESIENGSFFQVLDLYKDADADLIEQVNQVRRYRNWVAHGRRAEKPAAVQPPVAYRRLAAFLELIDRLAEDSRSAKPPAAFS